VAKLRHADFVYQGHCQTVASNAYEIERAISDADMVIGAVLVPGAKAPKLITNEQVSRMRPGSVLVDIAIDQGGCFEDSRPTTHADPTYMVHDSVFYCVANMPGAVPHTSTYALTNVTLPYAVAARHDGETVIRNASPNYMVQDLCFFLQELGVEIDGIGTTTLTVRGRRHIDIDVEYSPTEDPIEAMSLLAAAVVTNSEITIRRVPIEFLEIELATLEGMGMKYGITEEYASANGRTRLVDLTTMSGQLQAPIDKIHPMPFPGLNIDNLPFFALIAACAEGTTMIHDWVYENRAIYLTELTKVGARVQLLDPHRVMIEGPTKWRAAEVICPPALRPAVVVLLAMLAAPGTSVLRNVYVINRGYEDLAERLNALGATIQTFRDI
jgi:UDP-N-acetylglucosamine enolpyruvyl transferase